MHSFKTPRIGLNKPLFLKVKISPNRGNLKLVHNAGSDKVFGIPVHAIMPAFGIRQFNDFIPDEIVNGFLPLVLFKPVSPADIHSRESGRNQTFHSFDSYDDVAVFFLNQPEDFIDVRQCKIPV